MPLIPNNPYFLSCDPVWTGRTGTPYAMTGGRSYTQKYKVRVLLKEMSPAMVSLCPGVPYGGSPYIGLGGSEWDAAALLIRKTADQQDTDDWQIWIVTCEYSTELPTSRSGEANRDKPEQEMPDVSWDFETMQIAPMVDWDGKPFLNSALQPYQPAPTFPVHYPVLHISRNELTYTKDRAVAFAGALCDADFLGHPAEYVQCAPPQVHSKYRGTFGYWRASYKLSFAPTIPDWTWTPDGPDPKPLEVYRPWQPLILDAGMYERRDSGEWLVGPPPPGGFPKVLVPIYTAAHVRVTHPVPLDGGGLERKPDPATGRLVPVWKKYNWFRQLSFKDLLVNGLGGKPPPAIE